MPHVAEHGNRGRRAEGEALPREFVPPTAFAASGSLGWRRSATDDATDEDWVDRTGQLPHSSASLGPNPALQSNKFQRRLRARV
jgi:hypothetical protein